MILVAAVVVTLSLVSVGLYFALCGNGARQ